VDKRETEKRTARHGRERDNAGVLIGFRIWFCSWLGFPFVASTLGHRMHQRMAWAHAWLYHGFTFHGRKE